jgi:flagellar hook assembly protein FlgD
MNKLLLKSVLALLLLAFSASIFASTQESLSSFEISPNPMDKNTTVTLHFSQRVDVTITIEDGSGAVVKTLFSGDVVAGFYEYHWNRLSDTGYYVPAGKYYVNVSYQSRYTSTKKTLILK